MIEDESLIAMELEDMLEDMGHEVVGLAGTLERSLQLVETHGGSVDAVVLDANLGGASAAPVAAALRERDIPFLVASGYEETELRHLGIEGPRVGKPYQADEIDFALAALCRP